MKSIVHDEFLKNSSILVSLLPLLLLLLLLLGALSFVRSFVVGDGMYS